MGLPGPGHPKESALNCRKDRLAQVVGVKVRGKAYKQRVGYSVGNLERNSSLVAQVCNLDCLEAETGGSQVQGYPGQTLWTPVSKHEKDLGHSLVVEHSPNV